MFWNKCESDGKVYAWSFFTRWCSENFQSGHSLKLSQRESLTRVVMSVGDNKFTDHQVTMQFTIAVKLIKTNQIFRLLKLHVQGLTSFSIPSVIDIRKKKFWTFHFSNWNIYDILNMLTILTYRNTVVCKKDKNTSLKMSVQASRCIINYIIKWLDETGNSSPLRKGECWCKRKATPRTDKKLERKVHQISNWRSWILKRTFDDRIIKTNSRRTFQRPLWQKSYIHRKIFKSHLMQGIQESWSFKM